MSMVSLGLQWTIGSLGSETELNELVRYIDANWDMGIVDEGLLKHFRRNGAVRSCGEKVVGLPKALSSGEYRRVSHILQFFPRSQSVWLSVGPVCAMLNFSMESMDEIKGRAEVQDL